MIEAKLPDKLNEIIPIMSQTGFEILYLVHQYNMLSQDNPERSIIYEKIQDLLEYEKYFE